MSDDTAAPAAEPVEEVTGEVVVRDREMPALVQEPVIDRINPRQLELLMNLNPKMSKGAIAQGLELAWAYELDPFTGEIWFAEGTGGKMLIMIGRDGLRRICERNGLVMTCDVVRDKDEFKRMSLDGGGTVSHSYGPPQTRGEIVGAWARVVDRAGEERGFFFAPIEEYRMDRGPWKKQISVMIMAAAERQAARQATPLGGLMMEGEDWLVRENAGELPGGTPDDLGEAVLAVVERARKMGHAGYASVEAAHMATFGQPDEVVQQWVETAHDLLDTLPAAEPREEAPEEPADAEVVPEAEEPEAEPQVAPEVELQAAIVRAADLRTAAYAAQTEEEFVTYSDEADQVEDRIRALAEQLGVPLPEGFPDRREDISL